MNNFDFDLLIHAGRVVCSQTNLDGPGAVAISGDRIVAAGANVAGTARQSRHFPDALLLPGVVDLHAHPAVSGSKYGVDPDVEYLPRGVTTAGSQGDAGADNWAAYRDQTIFASRTRIRLAIHLSKMGESQEGPSFRDVDWVDPEACEQAIADGGSLIWGIAVNVSRNSCALDPQWVVRRGLEVAERTGKPLLYGMRNPSDWPIAEQLAVLRAGDVVTYMLREGEWSIVGDDGRVLPEVREARARGVLFDACHGLQSFSFRVAEAAFAEGFFPDTISTDHYVNHIGHLPPHDLPRTMSKFVAAGMPEHEAFARVGSYPAKILQLANEVGTLAPGACADLTLLVQDDSASLVDAYGQHRRGSCWQAVAVVRGGQVVVSSPH